MSKPERVQTREDINNAQEIIEQRIYELKLSNPSLMQRVTTILTLQVISVTLSIAGIMT